MFRRVAPLLVLLVLSAPPARAAGLRLPDSWFAGIVRRQRDTTSALTHAADTTAARDTLPPVWPDSLEDSEPMPEGWISGTSQPRLLPQRLPGFRILFDYNRVDQASLGAGLAPVPEETFLPRLTLEGAWSLARSQVNYTIGVEQPLTRAPYLALGGRVYRVTDTQDRGLVNDVENTLSALLFRQDYRDYFQRQGSEGYARLAWGADNSVRAGFRVDDLDPLPAFRSSWSLFGGTQAFRPNPAVPSGTLHQFALALKTSSRAHRAAPQPGMDLTLTFDEAGGSLGGDFRFSRASAEHRWTTKIAPGVWLNQRAAYGLRLAGEVPPEFLYYVGGVGTLRGYEFKQFGGDRFYLYNVEYAANLGRHIAPFDRDEMLRGVELVLFTEAGKAWTGGAAGEAGSAAPAWDAGAGVQTSGDGFHLYVAQNLRQPHIGPRLSVRLGRTF